MQDIAVERVLVVPTTLLTRLGHFQGFTADVDRYLDALLDPRHTSYRARAEMEHNPDYKQLIPYCIFRHRTEEGTVRVFAYTRGRGQGEERLRCKRSIGVGGHISLTDAYSAAAACEEPTPQGGGRVFPADALAGRLSGYEEGMRRELAEEVYIGTAYTQRCVGLINDDLTDVGRVHLGVVHLFELEQPIVEPREPELLGAAFISLAELAAERAQLESWSQICLDRLLLTGLA